MKPSSPLMTMNPMNPASPFGPSDYRFRCPTGAWYARLDRKRWGNRQNLHLFFTNLETGEKYAFSVFWDEHHINSYRPRRGGPDFHNEADIGDCFLLFTAHTKKGTPNLLSAVPRPESDAFTGLRMPDVPLRTTVLRRRTRAFALLALGLPPGTSARPPFTL